MNWDRIERDLPWRYTGGERRTAVSARLCARRPRPAETRVREAREAKRK
jgi:hypothetical protein